MAAYRLEMVRSAAKELDAVAVKRDRQRLVARIVSLAANPRPHGCQKLSGAEKYRVRQGEFRIVYRVDDARCLITLVKIGHRRDVYRG